MACLLPAHACPACRPALSVLCFLPSFLPKNCSLCFCFHRRQSMVQPWRGTQIPEWLPSPSQPHEEASLASKRYKALSLLPTPQPSSFTLPLRVDQVRVACPWRVCGAAEMEAGQKETLPNASSVLKMEMNTDVQKAETPQFQMD